MAHATVRAHQDELRNHWQADWENWQAVGQWRAIVSAGGQHLDVDSQSSGASADGSGYNLNVGGSYRLNEAWRVGVAAMRCALTSGNRCVDIGMPAASARAAACIHPVTPPIFIASGMPRSDAPKLRHTAISLGPHQFSPIWIGVVDAALTRA